MHVDSSNANIGDFHEETGWVSLLIDEIEAACCDVHCVQVLTTKFTTGELVNIHLDFLVNFASSFGKKI